MSAAGKKVDHKEIETPREQTWGDFTGRTGDGEENNWYREVYHDVRKVLEEAGEYVRFENMELPREQVIEKYDEMLEPGEDEYLEASLNEYTTGENKFVIMELEKGDIDGATVGSTGYSFRPTVQTDELPTKETSKLVLLDKGESETYTIMWEE